MAYTSTVSNYKLGEKIPGEWPIDHLGQQVSFPDLDYSSLKTAKPTLSSAMVDAQLVKHTGATALVPGTWAKWGIPGQTVVSKTAATDAPAGVVDPFLTADVAQDEYFWLIYSGPTPMVSGAALAVGVGVISDANGKTAAGTEAAHYARQLEVTTAADQLKRVYVMANR